MEKRRDVQALKILSNFQNGLDMVGMSRKPGANCKTKTNGRGLLFGNKSQLQMEVIMAKVTMPLMSATATGKFGGMVFSKRNIVRILVIPANPNSVAQQEVRGKLGDVQKELKQLGPTLKADLYTALGPRWNSMIIGELTANNGAVWDDLSATYTAYSSPNKAAWAAADPGMGLVNTAGLVFFLVAMATYNVTYRATGVGAITEPTETGSATALSEWSA